MKTKKIIGVDFGATNIRGGNLLLSINLDQ